MIKQQDVEKEVRSDTHQYIQMRFDDAKRRQLNTEQNVQEIHTKI